MTRKLLLTWISLALLLAVSVSFLVRFKSDYDRESPELPDDQSAVVQKRPSTLASDQLDAGQRARTTPDANVERKEETVSESFLIEELRSLFLQSFSDREFYAKTDSIYQRIPLALVTGRMKRSELSLLAQDLYASVDRRDLNVAIVLTSELGEFELINSLKNLFSETNDNDQRLFILEELASTNFTNTEEIDRLIRLAEEDDSSFSVALTRALVRSGRPAVLDWVAENIDDANEDEDLSLWLTSVENVGYKNSDDSVDSLISLSESTSVDDLKFAIFKSLGRIGSNEAQDYLYSVLDSDGSIEPRVVEALSRASTLQSWSQIQDQFIFGDNLEHRLAAMNAYAIGYSVTSKAETINTLRKIAVNHSNNFPTELAEEADQLLDKISN